MTDKIIIDIINKTKDRYIPAHLDKYYFLCNNGDIFGVINDGSDTDNYRISVGNCFRTKEDAEKHKRILINTQKLKDLADRLNNGEKTDWSATNNQIKYSLGFYASNTLEQYKLWNTKTQGSVCCLDENFLEKVKEEIGEEELIELIKGE